MASRKLKPYFQSHPIIVRTSQPVKKVLESRNQSTRMANRANQLAVYGIEFKARTTIKAQALADFIAETIGASEEVQNDESWKLFASGAKNVLAYTDSQVITRQVNGEYEAKNDNMKMYLTKV